MNISRTRVLFIQRVITGYRLDLLKLLCEEFAEVGIVTSGGDAQGTLKVGRYESVLEEYSNLKIHKLPSKRIGYTGESRSTNFFLYPKAVKLIKHYDVIVFEGTTNLVNNSYLVPYAKMLGKKTIWWDAGYSLPDRTSKRKLIDAVVKPFIKMTDAQMAYSTLANNYMRNYMGAKNSFLNLNTINTSYFDAISDEIKNSIENYSFDNRNIKLLYVGVVESRKKVKELIDVVIDLNKITADKQFVLNIIGGGNQLDELIEYTKDVPEVKMHGPIYDKEKLKSYYFKSDLFVLPGDGGLAILQSLLFGLPVLSINGADGTELDYITDDNLLADSLNDIKISLISLENIDRKDLINKVPNIKDEFWKTNIINIIEKI